MRVRIWGLWNEDGTFEASQIDLVTDNSTNRMPPPDQYGMGAYGPIRDSATAVYQGYMSGTVSSFEPYNMRLGRGNGNIHVTLHDGTVINPTGTTLAPDMRVHVWGHWNGNNTFEADQIDVVNAAAFGN